MKAELTLSGGPLGGERCDAFSTLHFYDSRSGVEVNHFSTKDWEVGLDCVFTTDAGRILYRRVSDDQAVYAGEIA